MQKTDARIRRAVQTLGLTPAQSRIVELLASGYGSASVANGLGVTPNTVRAHLRNLYLRLGIAERGQLVALVLAKTLGRRGLPDPIPATKRRRARSSRRR